jgi:hypothetical protein
MYHLLVWFFVISLMIGCSNSSNKPFNKTCTDDGGSTAVIEPRFVRNLTIGNTGWFSSPAVYDLEGDGKNEIIAPFYDIAIWDAEGNLKHRERRTHHTGRVYAPAVIADLEGDGTVEVVVAAGEGSVAAYEWTDGALRIKDGWPATTCISDSCFENRSLAADDLDGDGTIEVVVSSTRSEQPPGYESTNPHLFVFEPDGSLRDGWPRYDTREGIGRDLEGEPDGNCYGHSGFGSYGLNLGIGDIDDDDEKEIIATFDNHTIQAFNPDGTALLADPTYFTRRENECTNAPMSWGQFIRYLDPDVEENHYYLHQGDWPGPSWTMWLQWSTSPPSVGDINGDGLNEVICAPRCEQDIPYRTYHHAVMVLEGDYSDNNHRSARRLPGWEVLPLSGAPRTGIVPSPTLVNIEGDTNPEILTPSSDGYVYAFSPDSKLLWRYHYGRGISPLSATEMVVADLSRDGRPEIIFGVYGKPGGEHGRLIILSSNGDLLYDIKLPGQNSDSGNGVGPCAAPTIADVDGDGTLEILVLTIDHGLDIFTVEGSACNCTVPGGEDDLYCGPWPTGRGNYLRNGRIPGV